MQTEIIFLLSVLTLFLLSNAQYNASECNHMREPKLLRSCCKIPQTDEIIKRCRRELLTPKLNESADWAIMRKDVVGLHMCIAECEFKAKGYLTAPMEVDLKVIEKDLRVRHPQDLDYVQLLMGGFNKCLEHARNQTQNFAWLNPASMCNMYSATLLACATEAVYENCPTRKWHNTPACKDMRTFLRTCDELKQQ